MGCPGPLTPTPLPRGRGVGVRGPGVSVNHTPLAPKATPSRGFLQAHRGSRPVDPAEDSRVAGFEKGRAAADLGEDGGCGWWRAGARGGAALTPGAPAAPPRGLRRRLLRGCRIV